MGCIALHAGHHGKPLSPVPEGTVIRSLKPNEGKTIIETVNTGVVGKA
ncbi:MAG: hypothetical protein QXZ47_01355 [Candidatus Bathyarchaeia archaeon]